MLTIELPEEIEHKLNVLAKQFGKTQTDCIQEALIEYLNDLEDYMIAEQRVKNLDESKTVSLEEMMRRYGMEN
jgi:RHH-type transcriptional regulator, rel operon repressor / antitoxin RelB